MICRPNLPAHPLLEDGFTTFRTGLPRADPRRAQATARVRMRHMVFVSRTKRRDLAAGWQSGGGGGGILKAERPNACGHTRHVR